MPLNNHIFGFTNLSNQENQQSLTLLPYLT